MSIRPTFTILFLVLVLATYALPLWGNAIGCAEVGKNTQSLDIQPRFARPVDVARIAAAQDVSVCPVASFSISYDGNITVSSASILASEMRGIAIARDWIVRGAEQVFFDHILALTMESRVIRDDYIATHRCIEKVLSEQFSKHKLSRKLPRCSIQQGEPTNPTIYDRTNSTFAISDRFQSHAQRDSYDQHNWSGLMCAALPTDGSNGNVWHTAEISADNVVGKNHLYPNGRMRVFDADALDAAARNALTINVLTPYDGFRESAENASNCGNAPLSSEVPQVVVMYRSYETCQIGGGGRPPQARQALPDYLSSVVLNVGAKNLRDYELRQWSNQRTGRVPYSPELLPVGWDGVRIQTANQDLAGAHAVCVGSPKLTKLFPANNLSTRGHMLRKNKIKDRPVRFQVEVTPEMSEEMDELQRLGGLSTKKELLNNALTLLRWAITQREDGYIIACVDDDGDVYRELQMPVLEHAAILSRFNTRQVHSHDDQPERQQSSDDRASSDVVATDFSGDGDYELAAKTKGAAIAANRSK